MDLLRKKRQIKNLAEILAEIENLIEIENLDIENLAEIEACFS